MTLAVKVVKYVKHQILMRVMFQVTERSDAIEDNESQAIYHLMGIYMVGFISTISAAVLYFLHIGISQKPLSIDNFALFCIPGAYHWFPLDIIAYATMIAS